MTADWKVFTLGMTFNNGSSRVVLHGDPASTHGNVIENAFENVGGEGSGLSNRVQGTKVAEL